MKRLISLIVSLLILAIIYTKIDGLGLLAVFQNCHRLWMAIALAMVYAKKHYINGKKTLPEILNAVMVDIDTQGLDILTPYPQGDLALFRPLELAAALNRLRTLQVVGCVTALA